MKRVAKLLLPLLLAGASVPAAAGFGFGMSDDGFNTWDPEDYRTGYPRDPYKRWSWGPDHRNFFPPSPEQKQGQPARAPEAAPSGEPRESRSGFDQGWGSWGGKDPKSLKFGTGNFNFGDAWKPSFGDSWGKRRYRGMPPYGYQRPAPAWGGYPPPPPWGGYAPAPRGTLPAPQAPAPAAPPAAPTPAVPGASSEAN